MPLDDRHSSGDAMPRPRRHATPAGHVTAADTGADGIVLAGARWFLGPRIMVTAVVVVAGLAIVWLSLTTPEAPAGAALAGLVLVTGAVVLGPRRKVITLHRARRALLETTGHPLATRRRWIPLGRIRAVQLCGRRTRTSKGGRRVSFHVALLEGRDVDVLARFDAARKAREHAATLAALTGLPVEDEIAADLAPREERLPADAAPAAFAAMVGHTDGGGRPGLSTAVLVAANFAPLAGVVFLGWSVFPVMLLFWLENVICGVYFLLRVLTAGSPRAGAVVGRAFMAAFFAVHYGAFCFGHGVFVFALFGRDAGVGDLEDLGLVGLVALLAGDGLWLAVLALAVSHGVSFVVNWLPSTERREMAMGRLAGKAYGRIIVLHVAIIGGGFLVEMLGSPTAGLALLVLLKVAIDVVAHVNEHQHDALLEALRVHGPAPRAAAQSDGTSGRSSKEA